MDADDRQVGRLLSRRETLALLGAALLAGCAPARSGEAPTALPATLPPEPTPLPPATLPPATLPPATAAVAAAPATSARVPACVVRPELTEGPFFVDAQQLRSDIRSDTATGETRPGAPLALTFFVSRVDGNGCQPLPGAVVDIWHCDAHGAYSGAAAGAPGQDFLRGHQVTDAQGRAAFTTIYPGWYTGRAVHIHFKVRTDGSAGTPTSDFTSQLFFDDAVSNQVYSQPPYEARGEAGTPNAADGIYRGSDGLLTLTVTEGAEGYAGTFDIGLQLG
jgi:protocatechuate 3,4-dioxygenase beta subunit